MEQKRLEYLSLFLINIERAYWIGAPLTAHFMNSGELIEYYLRNDIDKIRKNIDFYDYVEVLPKSCYNELYEDEDSGAIKNSEDIEQMNKFSMSLLSPKINLLLPLLMFII